MMSPVRKGLWLALAAVVLAACATDPSIRRDSVDTNTVPDTVVQRALESMVSGRTIRWQDRTTGEAGSITPVRTFRIKSGQYCRDYDVTYDSGDGVELAWTETACRNPERGWLAAG